MRIARGEDGLGDREPDGVDRGVDPPVAALLAEDLGPGREIDHQGGAATARAALFAQTRSHPRIHRPSHPPPGRRVPAAGHASPETPCPRRGATGTPPSSNRRQAAIPRSWRKGSWPGTLPGDHDRVSRRRGRSPSCPVTSAPIGISAAAGTSSGGTSLSNEGGSPGGSEGSGGRGGCRRGRRCGRVAVREAPGVPSSTTQRRKEARTARMLPAARCPLREGVWSAVRPREGTGMKRKGVPGATSGPRSKRFRLRSPRSVHPSSSNPAVGCRA